MQNNNKTNLKKEFLSPRCIFLLTYFYINKYYKKKIINNTCPPLTRV